ncbi:MULTISPECIES: hypothetical protein [Streptomyces]|uniref:Methyltransferase n=2 Tax=Streptomyces TaxID=1883 RepID=A0A100Y189_9ACTN|nr:MULTISPECIES: hypothetical protein [Streptomyces]KUH35832.1 hypothetical protein ATE80_26990 [Streptomyces kanasensis]UUS31470.1 class I SAM-dependent methyltransferase [Streptomyces changanensis]
MPPLLNNPLTRRLLRPAVSLVEQRMDRVTAAFQKDLDALHHELADLRRQSYGLGLLLDHAGRDAHRMPTPTQVDRLVGEVRDVTGLPAERVRGDVTVAYRHLVALEALGAGGVGGSVSDVCGRLAALPVLAPARGGELEVLEVGTVHGLFAAALRRMLRRDGVEARLTVVDPLDSTPTREDVVRGNLALGGGRPGDDTGTRLVRGALGDPAVRERVADRRYGVVVVNDGVDAAAVRELAGPGGVVVLAADVPGPGLAALGRVAESAYFRSAA